MLDGCQGKTRTPTIIEKVWPQCGFIAYNDTLSCVLWCQYARKCVGDEMYEHMMEIAALQKAKNKIATAGNRNDPLPAVIMLISFWLLSPALFLQSDGWFLRTPHRSYRWDLPDPNPPGGSREGTDTEHYSPW